MKLDKILEDALKIKLNPRKPIFYTRVKMLIWQSSQQWVDNCSGMLIFYTLNNAYYFTVLNIIKFQVDFDMQIYTNFLKFAKFIGQACTMQFLVPTQNQNKTAMFILESKAQLTDLKRKLEQELYKNQDVQQLQFFHKPQVQQLLKQADISEESLQTHIKLRNQVQQDIKKYFNQLQNMEKTKKSSGFKAYGLGRQQWRLQQNQKEFLKEKKKADIIAQLTRLNKQSKML